MACLDALGVVLAVSSGILFGGVVQGGAASAACATLGSAVAFGLGRTVLRDRVAPEVRRRRHRTDSTRSGLLQFPPPSPPRAGAIFLPMHPEPKTAIRTSGLTLHLEEIPSRPFPGMHAV